MKVGCNYWASHAGVRMWSQWNETVVRQDFERMAEAGIQSVRVFPLWPDFQPLELAAGCQNRPRLLQFRGGPLPEHLRDGADGGPGPLAGLATCLARARAQGWAGMLTLPCDMPHLPEHLLRALLEAAAEQETALAVFYRTQGGWEEPLAGVYRCGALPFLTHALQSGQRRVRSILPESARLLLPLPEAAHSLFANCNTPEQARALGVDIPTAGDGTAARQTLG